MTIRLILTIALLFFATSANAEKRFAKKTDGFDLNQSFVYLQDGTFYATKDKKIVPANRIKTKEEAASLHNKTIEFLNRFRYWNNGYPPEKNALSRYMSRSTEYSNRRFPEINKDREYVESEDYTKEKREDLKSAGG